MVGDMDLRFYHDLPEMETFEQVTDSSFYRLAPEDWSVILSDIQGSTKAIEAGKYKDVNLIGAATIALIQNVIETRAFPFVFGGDGATILLPNDAAEKIRPALSRLQKHSEKYFDLRLRVGIVPLKEVYQRGGRVLVARYRVTGNNHLAMFQGGGLQIAEQLLKREADGGRYLLESVATDEPPELQTLSCRWAPIQNRNGFILSVLVQALDASRANEIYGRILAEIHPIFNAEENRPASLRKMRHEGFFANLRREMNLRKDLSLGGVFRQVVVQMLMARIATWFPFLPGADVFHSYLSDCMTNSDYKKLDDTLRMILDCTPAQADKLEAVLQSHFKANEIIYGTHKSETALMTCVMESLDPAGHIHFIDGGDGGYAMAAKAMKAQVKIQR